jgi:hypothetical protein
MKHRTHGIFGISVGVAPCAMLLLSVAVMAEEADAVRAVKLDPDKLAGINLPAGEPFIGPEDVLQAPLRRTANYGSLRRRPGYVQYR